MDPSAQETVWRCGGCHLAHRPVPLRPGEEATCGRCGTRLRVRPRTGPSLGLAWTVTALALFLAASRLPILEVSKAGMKGSATILVAEAGLNAHGMPLLGALAGAMVIWIPLGALLLLAMVNLSVLRGWTLPGWRPVFRLLRFARNWAMPEVFLLAVLVAFLKIGDLAETRPGTGLWFLVGGALAMLAALQRIDRDDLATRLEGRRVHAHGGSRAASAALLVAALILLVPANLLPIMEVRTAQGAQVRTIFGGVVSLAEHHLWGIAAIVFVASIVVPVAKIGGLGWLHWQARQRVGNRWAMRVHRTIEFIGRWSMLDIFLVALLAGLIQFGDFAEVRPGPAAQAFAAAVILTVLAVEQFDTRLLWRPARTRTQSPPTGAPSR